MNRATVGSLHRLNNEITLPSFHIKSLMQKLSDCNIELNNWNIKFNFFFFKKKKIKFIYLFKFLKYRAQGT